MTGELREDRRIQKTRQLLADSLGQLMREKEHDAITIQDIIDKANVGRSSNDPQHPWVSTCHTCSIIWQNMAGLLKEAFPTGFNPL